MIHSILIILLSIATIYNLVKRTDLIYNTIMKRTDLIALTITSILLFILCYFILPYNLNSYFVAIAFMLFTISSHLVRGFNKKGVYNINEIVTIARFIKWQDIKAINIAYNEKEYIDVTFVTDFRSFEHRYKNEIEKILIKVKVDLKI